MTIPEAVGHDLMVVWPVTIVARTTHNVDPVKDTTNAPLAATIVKEWGM